MKKPGSSKLLQKKVGFGGRLFRLMTRFFGSFGWKHALTVLGLALAFFGYLVISTVTDKALSVVERSAITNRLLDLDRSIDSLLGTRKK